MSDDAFENWRNAGAAILFAFIALLIASDLYTDRNEGAGILHLGIESTVLVSAAIGAILMSRRIRRTQRDLAAARDDADRWRRDNRQLVDGLGAAIKSQFAEWSLTEAETDIGLFLLKGLSHKDIAVLRNTSERTVREQSRSLYRKSGLAGRTELSAYFLEDLLPAQS